MRGKVRVVLPGVWIAAAIVVPPASADQQITAGPGQRYNTPAVTIAQGEPLTFANRDLAAHDVTASAAGDDGKPLFASPLINQGETAFVEGSQFLTTGSYAFVCSIHTFMTGTLTVSADGTPVPRPGVGGAPPDTTAPKLAVALKTGTVRKARADKAVTIVTDLDEAARITAKAVLGGRTIGTLRASLGSGASKLRIKLGAAARKQLRAGRAITVKVTAKDGAGNRATRSARRKLR